jgi:hypothetical protein
LVTQLIIESLVSKVGHLITNFIGIPLDISQDIVISAHKLNDLALEGIANGINFYLVNVLE